MTNQNEMIFTETTRQREQYLTPLSWELEILIGFA